MTSNTKLIKDVQIKPLKALRDERGFLMEILRSDEEIYEKFGQAYVTVVKPRIIKGWHYHKLQTDHFVGLKGSPKVVLYDARKDSPTFGVINEYVIGFENPLLIKIPTLVYHAFMAVGKEEAMILNIPTLPYNYKNPDEFRIDPFGKEVVYDWGDVDRSISR